MFVFWSLLVLLVLCTEAGNVPEVMVQKEGSDGVDVAALKDQVKEQHLPNEAYDDLEWTGAVVDNVIYACKQYVCACAYVGNGIPCRGPNDHCFSCSYVSGVSPDVDSEDVVHCALRCGHCTFNETGFPRGCCVDTGQWASSVYGPLTGQWNWFVENNQWHHYSNVYFDLPDQFAPYRMNGVVLQSNTTFDCDCGCDT
jgi:hypothetical protein